MKCIVFALGAAITLCLITAASQAQGQGLELGFHVPFAFTVDSTTFPAGEYEAILEPAHMFLELRNVKDQAATFQHVQPARSRMEADGRVRLLFHQYGNEYFLATVSGGTSSSTYDCPESKAEKRLADASSRLHAKTVSLLPGGAAREADSPPK